MTKKEGECEKVEGYRGRREEKERALESEHTRARASKEHR